MLTNFFGRSELAQSLYSFRREFIWVGIFSAIANLLMLSPSLYMMQVFDRVLISRSELTLIFLSVTIILLFSIMALAEWLRSKLLVRVGIRLDQMLNVRVFDANFQSFLDQKMKNPTEFSSNLTTLRQFLTSNGIIAFFDAPWIPIYIFVLFLLHPALGLLAIFFGCIQIAVAVYNHRKSSSLLVSLIDSERASKNFLYSKLRNAEVVESMGMQNNLMVRWLDFDKKNQVLLLKSQEIGRRQESIIKFFRYCMQSFTLGFAAILVIRGELTAGSMLATNVLMTRALQPIDLIVGSWGGFFQAKDAFNQLENLLENYPKETEFVLDQVITGSVKLSGLTATTEGRIKPILDNLDAEFQPGQITAIIGPSGSGKSTLARCLLGIWPNFSGKVLLNKKSIKQFSRDSLGPQLGYMPQDIELLDGTVAENISRFYGADPNKVIEAAMLAGVHEMILRLPAGYDTQIGQLGVGLSGGQRQRIALARAFYGNPSLIVLDEPNSNLDEIGERAFKEAILKLKNQGKTVFIITHRANILETVDYILLLADGKIVKYGSRNDVLLAMKKVN